MKPIRWTVHALDNLADREIDRSEAEHAVTHPELVRSGQPGRQVFMRRYFDRPLGREMLLRVIIEETAPELVVVTAYKTSQVDRYLKGAGR